MQTVLPLMSVSPFTVKVLPRPGASSERPAEPVAADGSASALALAAPAALEAWGQEEGAGVGRAEARQQPWAASGKRTVHLRAVSLY